MTGLHTKIFFVACRFTVAHALIYALPNLATFLRGHCNVKRHLYFAMFYFYSTPKMSQKQTSSHTSFFKTDKQSPRRKLVRNCEYQLTFDECTPLVVAAAAVSKKFPGRKKINFGLVFLFCSFTETNGTKTFFFLFALYTVRPGDD